MSTTSELGAEKTKTLSTLKLLWVEHKAVVIATIIVTILWLLTPLISWLLNKELSERGQFGDMYGVVTSLFTGLTIIGLVYTIKVQLNDIGIAKGALEAQMNELELNRKELKLNREEQKQARLEFEEQNRTLRYQRFDSTYFNLLSLLNEVAKPLSSSFHNLFAENPSLTNSFESTGTAHTLLHLQKVWDQEMRFEQSLPPTSLKRIVDTQFYQYISNLSVIIDFIIERKKNKDVRLRYYKILFAQMSFTQRRFLLYYLTLSHSTAPTGFQEYKRELFNGLEDQRFFTPLYTKFD